jgi:hypothetical protein
VIKIHSALLERSIHHIALARKSAVFAEFHRGRRAIAAALIETCKLNTFDAEVCVRAPSPGSSREIRRRASTNRCLGRRLPLSPWLADEACLRPAAALTACGQTAWADSAEPD